MIRSTLQRFSQAFSTLRSARPHCDSAFDVTLRADAQTSIEEAIEAAMPEPAAVRALRVASLIDGDNARRDFTLGLRAICKAVPQLAKLGIEPTYWRKPPIHRRPEEPSIALPHAPSWQWSYPYPHTPEIPPALRGLTKLRCVHLGAEATAALGHLPASVDSVHVELGQLSELPARMRLRLSNVRDLHVTTTSHRLPEANRIIEAAPRLTALDLILQDEVTHLEEPPFDLRWPQDLQSLRLELREPPYARYHDDGTANTTDSFLGNLWKSLPPLQELTLDLNQADFPLHSLILDLPAWHSAPKLQKLVFNGTHATQADIAAIRLLMPDATLELHPPAAVTQASARDT